MIVTVDISDLKVSAAADDLIVTHALGSCIAVMVYDPVRRAGGMIHYMLPLSGLSPERARVSPAMFADTGVPLLFQGLYQLGCERRNLVVKVTGGGTLLDERGLFAIGKRNYAALRKLLWKADVPIAAQDVGGARSRTARLYVGSGRCTVTSHGREVEL